MLDAGLGGCIYNLQTKLPSSTMKSNLACLLPAQLQDFIRTNLPADELLFAQTFLLMKSYSHKPSC